MENTRIYDIVICVSTQIDIQPFIHQLDVASDMLGLISEPTRLKILWVLLHGDHSVNELAEEVSAQQAAVSQHLAKLRAAQLVKARRDGNRMFYITDNTHVRKVIQQALSHAEHVTQGHDNDMEEQE